MKPIEVIAAALAEGATDAQKKAGAAMCRNLAAVLDSKPGQPINASAPTSSTSTPASSHPLLDQLGRMLSPEGAPMLDALIARMRDKLGDQAAADDPRRVSFSVPFVQVPQ